MGPRGPVVVRRRLGARLRELREIAGLRLEDAARELGCSTSKISRLEGGQGIPKLSDVRDLIGLYGVASDADRERMVRMAQDARAQGWWHSYSDAVSADLDLYISLEAESASIHIYSVLVLHGLLQTEDYARAVLRQALPAHAPDQILRLALMRIARQDVVSRNHEPLRVVAVIDEAAIWKVMGSADVMIEQLQRLIVLSKQDNIDLMLFPFEAGADEAISSFCIFHPNDPLDHTVVNLESTAHDAYMEQEAVVLQYSNIFENLRSRAIGGPAFEARLLARISAFREASRERGQ